MLRVIILGMVVTAVILLIWVAWGEYQAFRTARERDRHERSGS